MTLEDEIRGALAERVAAMVDDAAKRGDEAGFARAAKHLDELVDRLPLRSVEGVNTVDGGGERGRVLELFAGPPTMGDTAES